MTTNTRTSLQGVVRYTLPSANHIDAKWLSTWTTPHFEQAGIGKAARLNPVTLKETTNANADDTANEGFKGTWKIFYYEPDGKMARTPFVLRLEKRGEIWWGSWAMITDSTKVVLEGFGFEDGVGGVVMRYGS